MDLDLGGGTIRHSGGISLTRGSTVVRLEGFDIRLGDAPQLFASVNGGSKVAILDLDLSAATPEVSGRRITVGGVGAALTQGAADALNAAFATTPSRPASCSAPRRSTPSAAEPCGAARPRGGRAARGSQTAREK